MLCYGVGFNTLRVRYEIRCKGKQENNNDGFYFLQAGSEVVRFYQEQAPCNDQPESGPVFAVPKIKPTIESIFHRLILPERCNSRKEKRHGLPIRFKLLAKELRHCP